MKKSVFALCFILIIVLVGSVAAQDELPSLADLEKGAWTQIATGGDTICSNGTPYSFFVRPAESETSSLLIHFQGGGACWFAGNCDLTAQPTYDPFVDETDNPGAAPAGIFDFANEENPFLDYNMVMVPYCTGDVHIGDNVATYEVAATDSAPAREVVINHKGFTNATTVLDWTFGNFAEPDTVFVTGCSAGSIPSPLYTQFVAAAYPDARIEQLGDAAGGYRNYESVSAIFGVWGTMNILPEEYADFEVAEMTFERFYQVSGALLPDVTFTQYNTVADQVQTGFLALTGLVGTPLIELLDANFADIDAEIDNFFTYTAGGDSHCITPTPDFYTYQVDGLRFVDWVRTLAEGEEVDVVRCTECETAETSGE